MQLHDYYIHLSSQQTELTPGSSIEIQADHGPGCWPERPGVDPSFQEQKRTAAGWAVPATRRSARVAGSDTGGPDGGRSSFPAAAECRNSSVAAAAGSPGPSDPPLAGGGDLPLAGSEFWRSHRGCGHASLGTEIDDVIAAILVSRFSGRTVPEICAMGGITVYPRVLET